MLKGDVRVTEPFSSKRNIVCVGIARDDMIKATGKDFCYVAWARADVVG